MNAPIPDGASTHAAAGFEPIAPPHPHAGAKILCVDDDPSVLAGYSRSLRKQFTIETANGGAQALAVLKGSPPGTFAVIVADMQMPGMNGIELLVAAAKIVPDTVRLMLTGNADQRTAVEAVNQGHIFRFLNKPCPPEQFAHALNAAIRQHQLIIAERQLLEQTLTGSLKILVEILGTVEPHLFGLSERLRSYMRSFARSLNITDSWELEAAALLARIGYVTIPTAVSQKVRAGNGHPNLTTHEWEAIEHVPEIGANLLSNVPRLENVARIIRYQNKHFNGSGLPKDDVAGEEIPIGARILKVLSDLLQLELCGLTPDVALAELNSREGWYDPRVLSAVSASFDVYVPPTEEARLSRKIVTLEELRPGQVVVENVLTLDGHVVVPSATELSPVLLQRIRNFARLTGLRGDIQVAA